MKRQHRQKELTEVQLLKKENKELKKQVRSLQHQVRELQKHEHMYEYSDDVPEEVNMEDTHIPCRECGKGVYTEIELLGKVYGTCTTCGDRKKLRS